MTRINVFKTSTFLSKFFIVFGAFFTIIGILLLIKALINGFNTKFPSGDWNSVLFTFQGLLFIIMGAGNLSVRKYYIESVSYTHLRAHETVLDIVCRLL